MYFYFNSNESSRPPTGPGPTNWVQVVTWKIFFSLVVVEIFDLNYFLNILGIANDEVIVDEYPQSYDWKFIACLAIGISILLIIFTSIPIYIVVTRRKSSSKKIVLGPPFENDPESETSTLCDTNSQLGISFTQRIANFKNGIPIYKMNHPRRGLAIVFNHKNFNDNAQQRKGTNIDRKSIKTTLIKLDFEVRIYDDLCATEILKILEKVQNENHMDADCLCVVVLSHGGEDFVCAKDKQYEIKKLWEPFTADKCPSLAGKPKWFIFQVSFRDTFTHQVNLTGKK